MIQETTQLSPSEIKNGLNHKYTFQNFVQGEGNRMTLGAAIAVANDQVVCIIPYLSTVAQDLVKPI